MRSLRLTLLPGDLAVCRLPPGTPLADLPWDGALVSVTRTAAELSVVLPAGSVRDGWRCERGWRAIAVAGPLAFDETGVIQSIAEPLAQAGLSIFAISTFDTDYVLVRSADAARALETLREAGHTVGG